MNTNPHHTNVCFSSFYYRWAIIFINHYARPRRQRNLGEFVFVPILLREILQRDLDGVKDV